MILSLPTHEHGISLHVCGFALIQQYLQSLGYRSLKSYVRFIPEYFLFEAIVNGILNFNFWFTLYPAILPNTIISSSSFLYTPSDFPHRLPCHLNIVFFPSVSNRCLFLSLSGLSTLATVSGTVLNRTGETGLKINQKENTDYSPNSLQEI